MILKLFSFFFFLAMYILEEMEYLTPQGDLKWDLNLFYVENRERLLEGCVWENARWMATLFIYTNNLGTSTVLSSDKWRILFLSYSLLAPCLQFPIL